MVRDLARARERHTPTDTELALRASAGEVDAFDELYRRHAQSAWRVAQAIAANADDAADAVAEAFVHVFQALPAGRLTQGVPFRPYLLKATRNAAIDTLRRGKRVQPTDEISHLDETAVGTGPSEHVVISEEVSLVADAFRALPERWRSVLWLTEVEGLPARDVAVMLGMSANAVAQLALRARAGLRRNYLQAHVRNGVSDDCRQTVDRLGAYVAGALARRDILKVERHLPGCEECRARVADLEDVGSTLRRGVMPIPLAAGVLAASKWRTALAAVAGRKAHPRLVSAAARRALSGATAVVLGLGVAAVVVGPHNVARPPAPVVRVPAAAPATHQVALAGPSTAANGEPTVAANTARLAGTASPSVPSAGPGTAPPQSPTLDSPPTKPTPTVTPPHSSTSPALEVSASGVLGGAGIGVAAGVGPGACTAVALEPSAGGCIDPGRRAAGVTVQATGSLFPPIRLPLP